MPDPVEIIAPPVTPEPALRDALGTIAFLRRREASLIEACSPVADGGQYRADIVSAIQRDRRELEKLRTEHTRDQLLIGVQRGGAEKLLAACTQALGHSAAGEDLSVERVLRKAIADAGGPVAAAPAPARPEVVQASDRGVVADVLRILREDPSKQIAVVCSTASDCFDRFESTIAELRTIHGNAVGPWSTAIPGIRFSGLGGGIVRFFVAGRGLGAFEADVVLVDEGVSTCQLNLCDGSKRIQTKPVTHTLDGPEEAESDPCACDVVEDDGKDPVFDVVDAGDSLAAFFTQSVDLDTVGRAAKPRLVIEVNTTATSRAHIISDLAGAAMQTSFDLGKGHANEGKPISIGRGDTCVYRIEEGKAL